MQFQLIFKCQCLHFVFMAYLQFFLFRVDHITIPSTQGKGVLRRVTEVFDCWFESGSMPYAQQHYPFQRKREFEER